MSGPAPCALNAALLSTPQIHDHDAGLSAAAADGTPAPTPTSVPQQASSSCGEQPSRGHHSDAGASSGCEAAPEHCLTSAESACGAGRVSEAVPTTPEPSLTSADSACDAAEAASSPRVEGASPGACPARATAPHGPPSARRSRRQQAQRGRRRAEERARRRAVFYAEQLAVEGVSYPGAAVQLHVSARTLRSWRAEPPAPAGPITPRGRPPLEVDLPTRNEVARFLHHVTGPAVGLPALQDLFRNVPRCILEDLLRRYQRVWQRRYAQHGFELTWHHAGAVWAIDFTKPREPIDGVFPYLLAIRDLASHCQLAWRPVRSESVADVLPTLRELFAEHGPPLVLKSDNGSAFIAEVLHALLAETLVAQLFSPVRRPQYNGALERNNGVLKVYTHQHAVSVGHPFRWTAEDVDHAQQLANTISRPWGARGLSPAQAWHGRAPISAEARQAFGAALDAQRAWAARELALDLAADLSVADRARLERLAISGALQELGYLTLQRRGHIERPQRLSREELAKRVAQFRGAEPASESVDTESAVAKNTAAKSTAAECQVAENSTPAPSPEPATAEACDSRAPLLASSASSDILQPAIAAAPAPQEFSQETSSAQRERTFTSWLRRAFTPLLQLCKTAKISQ